MFNVDVISRALAEDRDYISSAPVKTVEELITERLDVCVVLIVDERVTMAQQADLLIKQIKLILSKPDEDQTKSEKRLVNTFLLKNNLVYKKCNGRDLFVMLKSMRKSIAVTAHDLSGHPALDIFINDVIKGFWFSKLRKSIQKYINLCIQCFMVKKSSGRLVGFLYPIYPGHRSFELVHIDHLGSFVTSENGYRNLLVTGGKIKYAYDFEDILLEDEL